MADFSPELERLASLMRRDWDSRVEHDYRFWMSDGMDSDEEMWRTGQRDFDILFEGYDRAAAKNECVLEIGCGVGRLLKPAASVFGEVIGVDVSPAALARARSFLSSEPNVRFVLGDGFSLAPVHSDSVDVVFSFAALGSMPLAVFAEYVHEAVRVLRKGGSICFQLYLGRDQGVTQEDTLGIRALPEENLVRGVEAAGFTVESIAELKLPFEVSDRNAGLIATIVRLRKEKRARTTAGAILSLLSPEGERAAPPKWEGSKTEYLMAVARADQHMNAGRLEDAKDALQFALSHFRGSGEEVQRILRALEDSVAKERKAKEKLSPQPVSSGSGAGSYAARPEIFERNLRILQARFPRAANAAAGERASKASAVMKYAIGASGAPVIVADNLPLDQIDKPELAAAHWAEQVLSSPRTRDAKHLIVTGFGGGYHIRALSERTQAELHVVDGDWAALHAALGLRDLSAELERIATFSTSAAELREDVLLRIPLKETALVVHTQTMVRQRAFVDLVRSELVGKRGLAELRPSIGVVGPIYGGTLPIARYTADALALKRQRLSRFDLGAFQGPYFELKRFVKDSQRVNVLEGHYVELLSQIVLEAVSEKPVDILIALAQAPLSARVLTELRDRGTITVLWFMEDCRRFTAWKHIARYYDYVFLIQKEPFLQQVAEAGAGHVKYLPVACDPMAHCPVELQPAEQKRFGSDISFVGAGYNNRVHMFASLAGRDFNIWGTEWPLGKPFDRLVREQGRRLTPDEYVKIFNSTKVNLNLHSSMERDGVEPFGDFVNPRTFELAACGAFQLVDNRTLLPELFEVGKELVTFSDLNELEHLIDYFVSRDEERAHIAGLARARALRDHTYTARLTQMLEAIYADHYDDLLQRQANSGWDKTFAAAEKYPDLKDQFRKSFNRGEEPTLDSLVNGIRVGKGSLSPSEQRLLFMHHIKGQTDHVTRVREGKKE